MLVLMRQLPLLLLLLLPLFLSSGCSEKPDELMRKGEMALACGNLPEAVTHLKKATKALPNAIPALSLLGGAYYRLGEMQQAAEAFDTILISSPTNLLALEGRARIAGNLGHWRDANAFFIKAIQTATNPQERSQIQTAWAIADDLRGDTYTAVARLLVATRLCPTNEVALYNLAVLFKEKLDFPRESAELYNLYLRTSPQPDRAEQAKVAIETLSERIQKNDSTRARTISETVARAEQALRANNPSRAINLYLSVVELSLSEATTLQAAQLAYKHKQFANACKLLLPLCYRQPRNGKALELMTRCCYGNKAYAEARLYGERYLQLITGESKAKQQYQAWLEKLPLARGD